MSLIIEVKTIPQKEHRYGTLGDYVGHIKVRFVQITDLGNPKYEFVLAIHELIEQALCLDRGISEDSITKFDMASDSDDPGADPRAPYHREHMYATAVEYSLCKELGIEQKEYDAFLDRFCKENMR